jgi:uncharacterized protein (DUF952 family)
MKIYHITSRKDWENAQAAGQYADLSLAREGVIHASTAGQVADTANRYYHGQVGLVLLIIDTERLKPEVRFEPVQHDGAQMYFPHVYGPLNLDAVIGVLDFAPDAQGNFNFTEAA